MVGSHASRPRMVVEYCRCLTSPLPLRLALPLVIFLFSVTGFSGHMLPHQQQIPSFEFPGQNPSKHCFPSCFRKKTHVAGVWRFLLGALRVASPDQLSQRPGRAFETVPTVPGLESLAQTPSLLSVPVPRCSEPASFCNKQKKCCS